MTEPKEESLDEQLREASVARKELQELIDSKGWQRVMLMVQEQQDDRVRRLVLNPMESLDAVPAQEFSKGKIAQLMEIAILPETYIATLDSTIETLTHQLEKRNEQTDT